MNFCLLALALFFPILALASEPRLICGKYYFRSKAIHSNLRFTSNELIFVCGGTTPGWENIPDTQARLHLSTFLRSRGYFKAEFKPEGDKIFVELGERAEVGKIEFRNQPPEFGEMTFIPIKGRVLNSDLLSEVRAWSLSRLKALGYPCPRVEVRAAYESETAVVELYPGSRQKVVNIRRETGEGLKPGVLQRYDAFSLGDFYNGDFMALTSRRLIASGIANYAYFKDSCEQDESEWGHFQQKVFLTKPQSLILAAGASTEEFPILTAAWKYSDIDDRASSAQAQLYLSPRRQTLSSDIRYYLLENTPRFFLLPSLKTERLSESVFKILRTEVAFGTGYIFDTSTEQIVLTSSPTYTFEDTLEGAGPAKSRYLSLVSKIDVMSHYFEYFQTSPRTGYQVNLQWMTQSEGLGSNFSGNQYHLAGTYLWNIGKYDPPIVVLGVRVQASTLHVNNLGATPQSFRLYLGGDQNIRGFGRNSINNFNEGFLTTSYLGFEGRLVGVLPYQLQPYLLLDFAKVGLTPFAWDEVLLYSPGLGLRWQSPVGVLRATASRGLVERSTKLVEGVDTSWTYFLSYGREF